VSADVESAQASGHPKVCQTDESAGWALPAWPPAILPRPRTSQSTEQHSDTIYAPVSHVVGHEHFDLALAELNAFAATQEPVARRPTISARGRCANISL